MNPAPVGARILLTVEISEVLFSAIQITASMSRTTVNSFSGSALRQTQISFFAEAPATSESEVVVLDVRPTPAPGTRARGELGSLQQAILDHLLDAPTTSGVFDLAEVRRTMLLHHHGAAVSRAVHQLIRRGVLESMVPTAAGFQPDVGREGPLRFVRCAG